MSAEWISREEAIMGTSIRVELWAEERQQGEEGIDAVMREMHRIDAAMSPWKADSELSRINREAAAGPVPLTTEMSFLLERSLHFSRLSGGAFDVTFAAVGNLYDYRLGTSPGPDAFERGRAAIGWGRLELDRDARTVRFAAPGMAIDLGGFAKGHAVECGAAILRTRGFRHAIVTAGGDSRILGDRRGRPWSIGVRDPRRDGEVAAVLPLEDVALSTSGDYERYFEVDGRRHHHLIDPRTGRSPEGIRSVTILAPDGLTSEAMSKSVFVLGLEAGMRLVDSQPSVDAVVIDAHGALHYSRGLREGAPAAPAAVA
jgi:thiamine biosynthesis lipoprotein